MKTLILNTNNVVAGSGNSIFQYNFPSGGFTFENDLIGIQSISQYFSVFNITQAYQNNKFSYIWVDGTQVDIVIPDSYWELTQINLYLQSIMLAQGHYLTSGGSNIFLLELVTNQSLYAVQLNCYIVSVAIATANTWVVGTNSVGATTWVLPTNSILPYLVVSQQGFGDLIGFQVGQYPASIPVGQITGVPPAQIQTPAFTSAQSTTSTIAPEITPYSSFLVYCSLVNNRAVIPSQLIFSYTPTDATFGTLQNYVPFAEMGWNKVENGQYNSFQIQIRDQLGRAVAFQDPNTLITLYTKGRDEWKM
jgi:hypothetical protein